MTTIVVADDEKIIRAGIKKILGEGIGGDLEILEAKNGKEALTLCMERTVHVLVTDIRMPVMDGVQLMDSLSALPQKPSIIVLSGYEEFSYARAAIASGAGAYILKPINKAEFLGAVKKAIDLAGERNQLNAEKTLHSLMYEPSANTRQSIDNSLFTRGAVCLAVAGDGGEQKLSAFIRRTGAGVLEYGKNCLFVVCPADSAQSIEAEPCAEGLSVGISLSGSSHHELKRMRQEAFTALLNVFFKKRPGIYWFSQSALDFDFSSLDEGYEQCISYIQLQNTEKVRAKLKELFAFGAVPDGTKAPALSYLYNKCTLNLFNRFPNISHDDAYLHAKEVMIESIMQASSLAEWQKYVTDYVLYLMSLLKKQSVDIPFIGEALDFLNANFTDPELTMATVSNYVSVNYTWFSEKFKEHTGLNFNDYVRRLRIAEAKKLIRTGRYKVYEVAKKCGFRDPKHFAKAFKEDTGLKPSEWVLHTAQK